MNPTRKLARNFVFVAGALLAVGGTAAGQPGDRAKVKEYELDVTWRTLATDFKPDKSKQFDKYSTDGKPFGQGVVVTKAPRTAEDKALVYFKGRNRRGTYRGFMKLEKDVVSTTPTKQLLEYSGKAIFDDGSGPYEPLTSAAVRIDGKATCRKSSGCNAKFELHGVVEY